jgi:ADP-dependent NAD(P)H-hydrate dehydratase
MPAQEIEITGALLRDWPLPQPSTNSDKEERGRVLIVGGSSEMPGTVILAALSALRAGAGKVQMAVCASVATLVGAAVLEGRVFAMPETSAGGIEPGAADAIVERALQSDAVVIGPGLIDEQSIVGLLERLLPRIDSAPILLDAGALPALRKVHDGGARLRPDIILTPHAGEMAQLLKCEEAQVTRNPMEAIQEAASRFKTHIVLKGSETLISDPDGALYRHRSGNVGLGTGGSGDALAGLMGGLLARGASPAQAAAWAVFTHARAGDRLSLRIGPLGFLARELLDEFPSLLVEIE